VTVSGPDVGDLAGVSNQVVAYWVKAADLDWRAKRNAQLAKVWREAIALSHWYKGSGVDAWSVPSRGLCGPCR
jgi:hypothetical protein